MRHITNLNLVLRLVCVATYLTPKDLTLNLNIKFFRKVTTGMRHYKQRYGFN